MPDGGDVMLDKLKANAWMLGAIAAAALSVVQTFRVYELELSVAKAGTDLAKAGITLADERRVRAEQDQAGAALALDDTKATFRKQEIHALNQQKVLDDQAQQDQARARALAAATAVAASLRNDLAAYLSAPGADGQAQGDAAACLDSRHRAATLGELFEEADRQAGELAAAAEKHADDTRTLKALLLNDRQLCNGE